MLAWFLGLLGQLYYSTTDRKRISREVSLSAAHAQIYCYAHQVYPLYKKHSGNYSAIVESTDQKNALAV